jgi:hypothetical protein
MSDPETEATAAASAFLAELESPTSQTKVLVTDRDVIIIGHATNKAACVAVSASIQTFARVAGMLSLLSQPPQMDSEKPLYHVRLVDSLDGRKAIVGMMASLAGIAQQCPGQIVFSDNRRTLDAAQAIIDEGAPANEAGESAEAGSFAESAEPAPAIHLPPGVASIANRRAAHDGRKP